MAEIKNPTLTGGTFFVLLIEATRREPHEHKKWGEGTGIPEEDVFEDLIKVAVPSCNQRKYTSQYKSVVSQYKYCSPKSGRFSIDEQSHITTFHSDVTQDYGKPLARMTKLVNDYVDFEGKRTWLVRALLEFICNNGCVSEDADLYVCEDGKPVKLSALRSMENICLPAFLLGIWHYIIHNELDNTKGKDTADSWCEPYGKNKRKPFKGDIGQGITHKLNIFMPCIAEGEDEAAIEDDVTILDEVPFERHGEAEAPEPEPIPNVMPQFINSPAIFFNSGANVMQISNTGTLNVDRSGKT